MPEREDDLQETGEARGGQPAKVASGCPFCLIMLDEGVGAKGIQETLQPVDVLELVAARLEIEGATPMPQATS